MWKKGIDTNFQNLITSTQVMVVPVPNRATEMPVRLHQMWNISSLLSEGLHLNLLIQ